MTNHMIYTKDENGNDISYIRTDLLDLSITEAKGQIKKIFGVGLHVDLGPDATGANLFVALHRVLSDVTDKHNTSYDLVPSGKTVSDLEFIEDE